MFNKGIFRKSDLIHITITLLLLGILMVTNGCGKEEFVRQQYQASGTDIGYRYIPAKVDIVMVPDNTGSITVPYQSVTSQFGSFVQSLQNQYWDYHVMKSLIQDTAPINSVLVNPEYNSSTLSDGTPNPNTDLVPSNYTITNPSQFTVLAQQDLRSGQSIDNTMSNTYNNLNSIVGDTTKNFLRRDALLAIIVVTNGIDGGLSQQQTTTSQPDNTKVANMANTLKTLKTRYGYSDSLIRFYPVTAPQYYSNPYCQGSSAWNGAGYFGLLNYLKGISTNFCDSNALSQVFNSISNDLNVVRQSFIFSNIVLENEPIESSIKVYKNDQEISRDSVDGWTYLGYGTTYTITGILDPSGNIQQFNSNQRTGYIIHLNGSAVLKGSDAPGIQYERK